MYAIDLLPEGAEDSPSGASLRGSHRLAAVGSCERLWALRYWWHYRPLEDNEWRLGGSLLHTCYQYYYGSLIPEARRPRWFWEKDLRTRLWEQAAEMREPIRSQLVAMSMANLLQYMQFYAEDRNYLEPLHIEEEFTATVGELDPGGPDSSLDNEIVTCRPDLIYRTKSGAISVLDYKSHGNSRVNPTTGRLTRWNQETGEYALNWQVLTNLHIVRARLGYRVADFVIQRTTRQEPYDFDRHVLKIPQLAYTEAPRVMRELVKQERESIVKLERGERPSPRFHACMGRFGPCDYRFVCTATDRDMMLDRLQTKYSCPPREEVLTMRSRLRVVT